MYSWLTRVVPFALVILPISVAQARSQCPNDTPADVCRTALREAAEVEAGLEGVNVSASFARYLRSAPEEQMERSRCFYRIDPSLKVRITRCPTASKSLPPSRGQTSAPTSIPAGPSPSNRLPFEGRWYVGDPRACEGDPIVTEGLLTYGDRVTGYETECLIASMANVEGTYELELACSSEGMASAARERVRVSGDTLHRTVLVGGKQHTVTARRCPRPK